MRFSCFTLLDAVARGIRVEGELQGKAVFGQLWRLVLIAAESCRKPRLAGGDAQPHHSQVIGPHERESVNH